MLVEHYYLRLSAPHQHLALVKTHSSGAGLPLFIQTLASSIHCMGVVFSLLVMYRLDAEDEIQSKVYVCIVLPPLP